MGMKRLISHNAIPTMISVMTIVTRGIICAPLHPTCELSLAKQAQHVGDQKNHQDGAESHAGASARAPAAMAVISSATSENQQQDNDENQHVGLLSLRSMVFAIVIISCLWPESPLPQRAQLPPRSAPAAMCGFSRESRESARH